MREAWTWRHAVAKSDLKSTTKLVLHTLGLHMNDAGENCFPSIKRIAQEASLTPKAVRDNLGKAVDAGWVEIVKRKTAEGDRDTNLYQPKFPKTGGGIPSNPPGEANTQGVGDQGDQGDISGTPRVGYHVTPKSLPLEHSNQQDSFELDSGQSGKRTIDTIFEEEFWPVWNRKDAKKKALEKFRTACKSATPETVIDGARAFMALCQAKKTEREFIPLASTWLHQERWNDEVLKPYLGRTAAQEFDPLKHDWTSDKAVPEAVMKHQINIWRWRFGQWYARKYWNPDWGPNPEQDRCQITDALKSEFADRYGHWKEFWGREAAE